MKKLIIPILAILLLTGLTSCEETFSMEFTNGSNDTYELYINDNYQQDIEGKTKVTYNIPSGYWTAKVVQVDGYLLFPTVKQYSGTYQAGDKYYIVFP